MRTLLVLALLLALPACGGHGRELTVGAVEDAAQFGNAPVEMRLAADSGLQAIALSAVWHRGERTVGEDRLAGLRRAVAAAGANDIRPIVSVYQLSGDTPVTAADRADFASFAASLAKALPDVHDFVVGNEPNIDLFWRPQFDPAGGDAAAPAFEALLAQTYDTLKAVDPHIDVIGVGLAPRGSDAPSATRETQSPTAFLLGLGRAYRASGRTKPIMDALSLHPYGESPRVPPTLAHPHVKSIGFADYDKLVTLLGQAFDGTGQPGRKLPIVYGEYGVETTIPPAKAGLYTGNEIVRTVDESTQAGYYAEAIRLAACQPTVRMLLFFHVVDESRLEGLQSGTRYADGSPKSSLGTVRSAARDAEAHGCRRS
ncbi:MAG TPA: hypothetical protein VLK36_07770 [Gaiellaceae bacterium]|nr:hypothetical protein [Gaiellaceae bacterium]